jgi:predicted transposase YdaD
VSKPFDVSSKTLIETAPGDWLAYLGQPRPPELVTVVDANVSTATNEADKVIHIADPEAWILHVEFQAQFDSELPRRVLAYNGLLQKRHKIPVATVVILLAPAANAKNLTGTWSVVPPIGPAWDFRYSLIRLWEQSPAPFLTGSASLLPFALLANVPREDLKPTARDIFKQLWAHPNQTLAQEILSNLFYLIGARYDKMTVQDLVNNAEELAKWPAYQALIETSEHRGEAKGRVEEARAMLFRLGTRKFGAPTESQKEFILALVELDKLENTTDRILTAKSWEEVLAE